MIQARIDTLKAAREELAGLNEVLAALSKRETAAKMALGEAEEELMVIRKIRGYARIAAMELHERITNLEIERSRD